MACKLSIGLGLSQTTRHLHSPVVKDLLKPLPKPFVDVAHLHCHVTQATPAGAVSLSMHVKEYIQKGIELNHSVPVISKSFFRDLFRKPPEVVFYNRIAQIFFTFKVVVEISLPDSTFL